ncbi:uncharacterized protein LOC132749922 isoform X3 [Ruditapes philippinarum]|uniref:uncharacterized protein LOC132749922 isoform X3 n=1 Tax=Ruditapes philippinarum TaxID=129788 RepID=UPI00295C2CD4|nr:uncharacterized protein LOC132749922 isoform X3 [Ruditapes philippinarum]
MHQNQKRETRYEPRYEDQRASPQRQMYERTRDTSPQRYQYNRAVDPRANPHSEVYDPRFNPASPLPDYHNFPQPYYRHSDYREGPERYQEKKFDFRLDNRYHKMPGERREGQPKADEHWQPAYAPYQERSEQTHKELYDQHKGYLVMVRFRPGDISEVINAIQLSVSTLSSHNGYCIGFSEPGLMQIVIPSHQMMAQDQWWDPRNQTSQYAVCCFWFQDYFQARSWFQTGSLRFKQPDFPNSNPYQVVAVPLTYGSGRDPRPFGPDRDEITLLWSEYPNIYERYEYDFRANYSDRVRDIVRAYGGNPYVSLCRYRAGEPVDLNKFGSPGYARFEIPERDKERVGRSWKNSWIKPDTFITVSTFPDSDRVRSFYNDREFTDLRYKLSQYSDPVVVAITLRKVQGTSRP